MVNFHSLNSIIEDIMLTARDSNISESEQLSKAQVEQWIIGYRATLIKQDIDKGRDVNPDYVQSIDNIAITNTDNSGSQMWIGNSMLYKSTIELPNGVDFHHDDSILSIKDNYGKYIQLTTEQRASLQQNRRYSNRDTVAYKKNKVLYLAGDDVVGPISIRMIAEDPMNSLFGLDADSRYPIPANMVPVLKDMILQKELSYRPSDQTNDSNDDTQNIKTK